MLTDKHRNTLARLASSGTPPLRELQRTRILLTMQKKTIVGLQRKINISHPAIYRCVGKTPAGGIQACLKDAYHSPQTPGISHAAITWAVSIACSKPKDRITSNIVF